jgi:hypothetical protein
LKPLKKGYESTIFEAKDKFSEQSDDMQYVVKISEDNKSISKEIRILNKLSKVKNEKYGQDRLLVPEMIENGKILVVDQNNIKCSKLMQYIVMKKYERTLSNFYVN